MFIQFLDLPLICDLFSSHYIMGIFHSKHHDEKAKTPAAKEKPQLSDADRATLELKRSRDRLKKQEQQLENVIAKEKKIAQQLLQNKQKDKAILILKRKQMQEKMLERARAQMLNVESMISNIQEAESNVVVFNALKEGNATLQSLQEQMSVDQIEEILDDTADAVRMQDEISAALGQNLNTSEQAQIDDEVDAMFAAWEADETADPFADPVPTKSQKKKHQESHQDENALVDQVTTLPTAQKQLENVSVDEETQKEEVLA